MDQGPVDLRSSQHSSSNCLLVVPGHGPQVLMGVVSGLCGYLQAVITGYCTLTLQEQHEQTCQASGNTLEGDVLQTGLVARE